MNKPEIELKFEERQSPVPAPPPRVPQITGMVTTVTVEPTGTPRSFFEQFRIFSGALWFYDTVTNAWQTAGGGGGVENFTDLADVPNSYTGHTGQFLAVNDAGDALQFADPLIPVSGVYTPTLGNDANITDSIAYECQYMRVGDTVTVSGRIDIDPVEANTDSLLFISLPISLNDFSATEQCGGVAAPYYSHGVAGAILAQNGGQNALLAFVTGDDAEERSWSFTFTYRIV